MYKKLTRSRTDVKIAGVCSGIGNYYNTDPTMVRLSVVLLTVITAFIPVIIVYIGAWMIIPLED